MKRTFHLLLAVVAFLAASCQDSLPPDVYDPQPEPDPGFVWGLGVKIRQNPSKTGNPCTPGTYGWSGAFGTHFFISPADELECVFMTNRSDLNGSGSYISKRLEELVFSQLRG